MDLIIQQANSLLNSGDFEYAFCGGYALDLFIGKPSRKHSDIDICSYEKDKSKITLLMKKSGWEIYEFLGQGIVHYINSIADCQSGRNLMCIRDDCEIVRFYPCEKGKNYFLHEFFHNGMTSFNYLEFLFNESDGKDFIYGNNVRRAMDKAILWRDNIPFLAPELVLLYKSKDTRREENKYDYQITIPHMSEEQISWFNCSLDILNSSRHEWRV